MPSRVVLGFVAAFFMSTDALAQGASFNHIVTHSDQILLHACGIQSGNLRCSINNKSDRAVASIMTVLSFVSEGRSIPWAEEEIVVDVPGGLEPGEMRDIDLPIPNLPEGAFGTIDLDVARIIGLDVSGAPVN